MSAISAVNTYAIVDCDDVCLDGGVLYEFNITDQYGDGMCCNMVKDISLFQLMELKSIMQCFQ